MTQDKERLGNVSRKFMENLFIIEIYHIFTMLCKFLSSKDLFFSHTSNYVV